MSKSIYEEALQELRYATVDLEDLEIIHSYDVSKIENALKLGKLYKELSSLYEKLYTMDLQMEIIKLKQKIKELEK